MGRVVRHDESKVEVVSVYGGLLEYASVLKEEGRRKKERRALVCPHSRRVAFCFDILQVDITTRLRPCMETHEVCHPISD